MNIALTRIQPTPPRYHVLPGDILRLWVNGYAVRVISGQAWITWEGEDILLESGKTQAFGGSAAPAVITALRHVPLIIEVSAA